MSDQSHLVPDPSTSGQVLEFDFPSLEIGVSQYAEGPTGATVFHFVDKAVGAVDVRGGAPRAYNVDWLRWGYGWPNLDALVVSGGSWYGLAASGGVAGALKEDGHRSGHWANLAHVAGAIIYDFGQRRPNEIHPDEKLGAAALRAARAGRFPQGANGAGRMTMQGSYFGLWLHSGQGGAFRQVGETKIACFAVVNSVGAVADRDGRLCFGNQAIPTGESGIRELVELVPANVETVDGSILGERRSAVPPSAQNTTISLVVTNRKLEFSALQRLAVQVHTSMGRAIQPFGTLNDGDVLFAASTGEVETSDLHPTDLGTVASEVMWDAILASVPDIPDATAVASGLCFPTDPTKAIGRYRFGNELSMDVGVAEGRLTLTNSGGRDIFGVRPGGSVSARPDGGLLFTTQSLFLPAFGFARTESRRRLVLNPGPWQQVGTATR